MFVTAWDLRKGRPAGAVGVARTTMGIPREVLQEGDWSVARALAHGLGTGLGLAGVDTRGYDPPDPSLARESKEPPRGWVLRLVLDRLWGDGYFNELSLQLGLRLHLIDPAGRLRARAEHHADAVLSYAHPEDFVFQIADHVRAKVAQLVRALDLERHLEQGRPAAAKDAATSPEDTSRATPNPGPTSTKDARCPACKDPVEPAWRHCAACGAALR